MPRLPVIERAKRWVMPDPDAPGTLRVGFIAAYIGLIGTVTLYSNLVTPCGSGAPGVRIVAIAVLLTLLVSVDRLARTRSRSDLPRQQAVALLLTRALLLEAVIALDCTKWSILLYPIIPFAAFFSLGPLTSYLLAGLYWLLTTARWWLADNTLFANLDQINALIIFTLLLVFTQAIARIIARDERSRQQTRRLLEHLEASHRQLQTYAAQVAELAAVEERNRLARDIHDSLGHHLSAINIQLEKALAYREHNPQEADQAVLDAKQMAHEALRDVRQSVSALRTSEADFSLRDALADLVRRMGQSGFTIDYHIDGDESGYGRPALIALYRVAQEGLTNVQRHANARHVLLDVQLGDDEARLSLRDDGAGFDSQALDELAASKRSFGLQGLQERLELVRGQLAIASEPRQGTALTVTIPVRLGNPPGVPEQPAQLAINGAS